MSSFLPAKKNFPFWKDATFRYLFEWREDNGKVVKPRDLTGYTGFAHLAPAKNEPGTTLELTTENGGIILGGFQLHEPKNGLIEIYVMKEQFEAVLWKRATYTLYLIEPSAPHDDYALLTGRFTEAGPPL